MINPVFYDWLLGLSKYSSFQILFLWQERLIDEQYDLEMVYDS